MSAPAEWWRALACQGMVSLAVPLAPDGEIWARVQRLSGARWRLTTQSGSVELAPAELDHALSRAAALGMVAR